MKHRNFNAVASPTLSSTPSIIELTGFVATPVTPSVPYVLIIDKVGTISVSTPANGHWQISTDATNWESSLDHDFSGSSLYVRYAPSWDGTVDPSGYITFDGEDAIHVSINGENHLCNTQVVGWTAFDLIGTGDHNLEYWPCASNSGNDYRLHQATPSRRPNYVESSKLVEFSTGNWYIVSFSASPDAHTVISAGGDTDKTIGIYSTRNTVTNGTYIMSSGNSPILQRDNDDLSTSTPVNTVADDDSAKLRVCSLSVGSPTLTVAGSTYSYTDTNAGTANRDPFIRIGTYNTSSRFLNADVHLIFAAGYAMSEAEISAFSEYIDDLVAV